MSYSRNSANFNKFFAVIDIETRELSCSGQRFTPQLYFNHRPMLFRSLQAAKTAATKMNNQAGKPIVPKYQVVVVSINLVTQDPQQLYDSVYPPPPKA